MIAANAIVQTPTATYCGDDEYNDEGYPDVDPTWLINWRNRTEYLLDATPAEKAFLQNYLASKFGKVMASFEASMKAVRA